MRCHSLHSALKSGVADIARTFGEKLVAFKFPPRIAKKLQSFVDYA
jgi:nucleoporin NDC1